jgi:hypothetical protein
VVYPQYFIRQSPEKRKKSLLRTAALATHMFESSALRTAHFVVGVPAMDRWSVLFGLEVSIDADDLPVEGGTWNLTGFLRELRGTVVAKFERELVVPATVPGRERPSVATTYHELQVAPGEYVFSVVLSVPGQVSPRSATHLVSLPRPPLEGPFVIGPILGHNAEDAGPGHVRFRPSFDAVAACGQSLESMSVLCIASEDRGPREATIDRSIATLDGNAVHRYDRRPVSFPAGKRVACADVVDAVNTSNLAPGSYEFRATGELDGVKTRQVRSRLDLRAEDAEQGGR